jgi:hypothetical protein
MGGPTGMPQGAGQSGVQAPPQSGVMGISGRMMPASAPMNISSRIQQPMPGRPMGMPYQGKPMMPNIQSIPMRPDMPIPTMNQPMNPAALSSQGMPPGLSPQTLQQVLMMRQQLGQTLPQFAAQRQAATGVMPTGNSQMVLPMPNWGIRF